MILIFITVSSLDGESAHVCKMSSSTRSVPFGMRVSTKLYKQIEDNRGPINRNRFIIFAIEYYLNNKKGAVNK